jgi:hypothetical protein
MIASAFNVLFTTIEETVSVLILPTFIDNVEPTIVEEGTNVLNVAVLPVTVDTFNVLACKEDTVKEERRKDDIMVVDISLPKVTVDNVSVDAVT